MRSGGLVGRWLAALSPGRPERASLPWEEAMAAAPFGVALAQDGVIVWANEAFSALCGRTSSSVVGAPWGSVVRASWVDDLRARSRPPSERVLQGADGSVRRLLAVPYRFGPGSRGSSLLLVDLDATVSGPRVDLPREIPDGDEDVVSLVAHEFRSPLGAIRSALTEVREWTLAMDMDGEARRSIVALVDGADRRVATMSRLASNLLDAGRLHYEGVAPSRERFDLRELVSGIVRDYAGEAEDARVTLRLADGAPVVGEWDRIQMGQVVGNLLSNAIKYGGSAVEVSVRAESGRAVLRVRDDGPGIDRVHHERIFERFERLAADGRSRRGVGLGLWVVRRIVDLHGGRVSVQSAPGAGAEFSVTVPLG